MKISRKQLRLNSEDSKYIKSHQTHHENSLDAHANVTSSSESPLRLTSSQVDDNGKYNYLNIFMSLFLYFQVSQSNPNFSVALSTAHNYREWTFEYKPNYIKMLGQMLPNTLLVWLEFIYQVTDQLVRVYLLNYYNIIIIVKQYTHNNWQFERNKYQLLLTFKWWRNSWVHNK